MFLHDKLTGVDIHAINAFTYANATARLAATGFVTADLNKIALQSDNNSLWLLTATTPTWVAVGADALNALIKTAAQWTSQNTVLTQGQVGYESDVNPYRFKVGDGSTAWNSLDYWKFKEQHLNLVLTGGTYTLSSQENQAGSIEVTGVLVSNQIIILADTRNAVVVENQTTGAYTLTFKTLAGTGIILAQGVVEQIYCNGTNCELTASGAAGSGDMILASAQTNSGLKTFLDATLGLRNVAATFTSFFTNTNTAARTYTLQNRNGILADDTDLALKAPLASPVFTGNVGIGAGSDSSAILDVHQVGNTIPMIQAQDGGTSSGSSGGIFQATLDNGTAPVNGTRIGGYQFSADLGDAVKRLGGAINALATETWTTIANGTQLKFNVTANGAVIRTLALLLNQDGSATFANTVNATTFVGALTGTASGNLVSGGALGTPSSGTLTNATGLPIAGLVASTSTALGVGSIELGNASDTTITRVSAGIAAIEGAVIATLSTAQTWTKAQSASYTTLTDAATVAVDMSLNNNFEVTLGGNRTLGVPTVITEGQNGVFDVYQDGTGSRTLAYS